MEYMNAKFDDILNDAISRGKEAVLYLKELRTAKPDGEGKLRKPSFITVKQQYFSKYLPDKLPKSSVITMDDKIEEALKKFD